MLNVKDLVCVRSSLRRQFLVGVIETKNPSVVPMYTCTGGAELPNHAQKDPYALDDSSNQMATTIY